MKYDRKWLLKFTNFYHSHINSLIPDNSNKFLSIAQNERDKTFKKTQHKNKVKPESEELFRNSRSIALICLLLQYK